MLIHKLRAITVRSENGTSTVYPQQKLTGAITLPNSVKALCDNAKI
jgi:hypothetical protein